MLFYELKNQSLCSSLKRSSTVLKMLTWQLSILKRPSNTASNDWINASALKRVKMYEWNHSIHQVINRALGHRLWTINYTVWANTNCHFTRLFGMVPGYLRSWKLTIILVNSEIIFSRFVEWVIKINCYASSFIALPSSSAHTHAHSKKNIEGWICFKEALCWLSDGPDFVSRYEIVIPFYQRSDFRF